MNSISRSLACAVVALSVSLHAAVISVSPDAEPSISSAVASAQDGDEIRLAAGTYGISSEIQIDKAVAIAAAEGVARDLVIVTNLVEESRLFTLNNPGASLSGITLTGGVAAYGGAVYLQAGTITNCVLSGNKSTGKFGSTLASGGAVLLASGGGGTVVDSRFYYNSAINGTTQLGGGAIAATARSSTEAVIRCSFEQNTSFKGGAAYNLYLFDPEFISHRKEGDQRGGLFANSCSVFRAKISPLSDRFMGGIFNSCYVYDTLFSEIVDLDGNGLQNGSDLVEGGALYNCTFTKCKSQSGYLTKNTSIYNSIAWGNVNKPATYGGTQQYNSFESPVSGTGNISVDPKLAEDGSLGVSACLNAAKTDGNYFPEAEFRTVDAAGNPRNALGGVDLGCFERQTLGSDDFAVYIERNIESVQLGAESSFVVRLVAPPSLTISLAVDFGDGCDDVVPHSMSEFSDSIEIRHVYSHSGAFTPSVVGSLGELTSEDSAPDILRVVQPCVDLYVSPTGDDLLDGSSVTTAKATLFQAYMSAQDGATIHLLEGDHRSGAATIAMDKPVRVVGEGTERTRFASDSGLLILTLNHASTTLEGVCFAGITNKATVLSVKNGTASRLRFESCKTENVALVSLANVKGMTMSDVVITNCYAANLVSGGSRDNVKVVDAKVSDSWGTNYGAAFTGVSMYRCRVERVVANNCLLFNCTAYDCFLSENQAAGTAEGILRNTSAYNCTVINNRSKGTQSTVIARNYSHYNSIFYGNRNYDSKGEATVMGCFTENATFYNCWIENGTSNCKEGDADNIFGNDPLLKSDYHLKTDSPCVNAGKTATTYYPNSALRGVDLDGKQRVRSSGIDLGCFELDPPGLKFIVR